MRPPLRVLNQETPTSRLRHRIPSGGVGRTELPPAPFFSTKGTLRLSGQARLHGQRSGGGHSPGIWQSLWDAGPVADQSLFMEGSPPGGSNRLFSYGAAILARCEMPRSTVPISQLSFYF